MSPHYNSIDPFTKKDWYDVKAPSMFAVRNIGKTLVTRTQGKSKKNFLMSTVRCCIIIVAVWIQGVPWFNYSLFIELASDGLKGRVFEVSLADLQNDEQSFRKFRLISEDVQGKNVLTNFHGMTMTTDKLRALVKKWQVRLLYCVSNNSWPLAIFLKWAFDSEEVW